MRAQQILDDVRSPEDLFKPRIVVIRGTEIAGRFEWNEKSQANALALQLAANEPHAIGLYEVDWRLPSPPPVGTLVDPDDYDWIQVAIWQPAPHP